TLTMIVQLIMATARTEDPVPSLILSGRPMN
ncbi:MAG: hypothetical protein ACI9DM_001637, partial [Cyclobacteriaceae bacterium]